MKKPRKPGSLIDSYFMWPLGFVVLMIPALLMVELISVRAGIVLLFFYMLYSILALWLYLSRRKQLLAGLLDFAASANEVQAELFREMPFAYAIVSDNGTVLWQNRAFREIAAGDRSQSGNLLSMFPNIKKEMLREDGAILEIHSSFQDRKYCIDLQRTHIVAGQEEFPTLIDPETKVVAVYLRDETEEIRLNLELEAEHIVCGLIYIDNYEEVLDEIEEVRQSLLTALVDRKINRYVSSVNGLTKKIEKDKYFFVLKQQYLQKLLDDRFSILDEVRQVNIGNEIAVTLSIGIGYGAREYIQNYDYARNSIDMALGRGGDQAIIKSPDKFTYFGGKSQSTERVTRVKARVKAQAFQELLESKDKVLIMGHANGDMDCLGASVGVYRIVTNLGKRAYIVQNRVTPPILPLKERFLNNDDYPRDMFISGAEAKDKVDGNTVLVIVDCNRPSILDEAELLRLCRTIVVFDHHRQSSETIQGAMLSYCEPYASSASEMITEMMQYIGDGIKVRPMEADCLYGGIVIDTQEFTNQTGVRTFEAAAYLRRCGADITRIRKNFREKIGDYQAKAVAISEAEIYREAYAFSTLSSKGLESPTVLCAQTANELLNIRGIKASIVLTKYNETIYVSARSIDEMNVQVLMEKLGGGGHRTIAGAQLREGTIEEAILSVKEAIDQMIAEGEVS
ncbi:MAG: DHH family phosphoesterase [Oribacterium sp.]